MIKLLLFLLLMVSTNVFAEWTEVGSNDEMNVYNDFSSVKKQANKTKMWSMFDFKTVKKIENDSKLTFFTETVLGNKKYHALFFTKSTASSKTTVGGGGFIFKK